MGFLPTPTLAGFNTGNTYKGAPGLPFLVGKQDRNFVRDAAAKGWLTNNKALNSPYTMSNTDKLTVRGTFEPFKGLRIELTALRSYADINSEYFYYNDTVSTYGGFYFNNKMVSGSYSISVITLGSAFEKLTSKNGNRSAYFELFKQYRQIISHRLFLQRVQQSGYNYQGSLQQQIEPGYSDGYGSTSSEVIIPAFLAAYTGKDPEKVTLGLFPGYLSMLPNWRLTFDGLTKIEFLARYFKSINIQHSYSSTYSINSFSTNLLYVQDEYDGLSYVRDFENNFIPELQVNAVSIKEEMNPLFGFDATWVNNLITRFEFRKSRLLALGLSNNQLTESKNQDFIIGAGYRFNAVKIKIGERAYQSDLNIKFDLSIRDNKTIIRYLAQSSKDEVDQITSGDKIFIIKCTADYLLSPRFNLQFFYDRTLNKPHTTRSFLRVDTNIGFSLRFTLSQ